MKNKAFRFTVLCFLIAFGMNFAFPCSAARYATFAVDEDFSAAAECDFLEPGDMNADGSLNAADLTALCQVLLNDTQHSYSDVNGDRQTNVLDLIRAKKNSVSVFVNDGSMNLNGNSIYNGEFISALRTGVTYQIRCRYRSTSAVTVLVNGLGQEKVFTLASTDGEWATVTNNFNTSLTIASHTGIELQVIGVASVDDFEIKQLNTDNEYNINS